MPYNHYLILFIGLLRSLQHQMTLNGNNSTNLLVSGDIGVFDYGELSEAFAG
jgi:hypothetical protein